MSAVDIRPIAEPDAGALRAFFLRVPEGDRTFFREDVLALRRDGVWRESNERESQLRLFRTTEALS